MTPRRKRYLDNAAPADNRTITIGQIPRGYVDSHGDMVVRTPKGVRTTLQEAYKNYNQTPVAIENIPGLTDYLLKQDNQDIQEDALMRKRAGDRFVHKLGEERDKALMSIAAGILGGGALASGLALAPVATLGSIGGSILGEKAWNKIYGDTWGQDVERWTNGYVPAEYAQILNPGTLIGGGVGGVGSNVLANGVRRSISKFLLSKAMNKTLSEVPRNYSELVPKIRTKVGDVEINNPQLMYHQKEGTNTSMFGKKGTGSILSGSSVSPGNPKLEGQPGYIWFNKGKPYVNHNSQYLVTTNVDNPNLIHVRSQNYPIGQWDGKKGFVTNSEYVSANPVSGTVYSYEPGYGYRRVNSNSFEVVPNSSIQPINDNNAALTSSANWDWNRDIALFNGDKKKLQQLRYLHFKAKASNSKVQYPVWHSSEVPFNTFDLSHFGATDSGFFGYGHYLTPYKKYAASYHPINRSFYVNAENPSTRVDGAEFFNRDAYVKAYINRKRDLYKNYIDNNDISKLPFNLQESIQGLPKQKQLSVINEYLQDYQARQLAKYDRYRVFFEGKDSQFHWRNLQGNMYTQEGLPSEIVIPNGAQIKSTLPITLDDKGNIIPLSLRDNFNINDIRFKYGGAIKRR